MKYFPTTMASEASYITMGNETSPGYTISLDAIDLSLMPILSHQRRDRTVPLWSCTSSGPGAEYCEFEVLVDDEGDSDDERRENASSHQCHVCGVSVCASLWQHHAQSATHRACQTIAHTSLVRAQQMALAAPIPPASPLPSRSYPCPPCSVAVSISKQTAHEHSEQHATSVLYGKLMTALAGLYENRDNLKTVCEDIFRAIADNDTAFLEIQTRLKAEDRGLKKTDHSKEDKDYYVKKEEKDCYNIKKQERDDDSASTTSSESEVSAKAANQQKLTSTGKPDYTILARSGAKLKVPFDNYHGFSNGVCRVCRVVVENLQEHLLDASHRAKVQVGVKDKQCIRQLSNILSHCVLCNALVGCSDEIHVLSETHIAALQRALVLDDITTPGEDSYTRQILADNHIDHVSFNDQNYYCKVCQIYIFKSALMEHVEIDAHKNGLSSFRFRKRSKAVVLQPGVEYCEYCKVGITGGKKQGPKRHNRSPDHKFNVWLAEKDSRLHYHFGKTGYPSQAFCKICFIHSEEGDINEHVDSFNHQTNYKKMLIDNHMEKTAEYKVDCFLCKMKLYMIDVLDHVQSKCHRKKMQDCFVNEIGPEEFKLMHQEKQDCENAKLKHILQSNQVYNYYNDETFYECMPCHMRFKKPMLLEHIISKKHKRACQAYASQTPKEIKPKNKSIFYVEHEKIETNANADLKENHPEFVEIKAKEKEANVDSKVEDENDQSELQLALKTNLIESHSDVYHWCNACKRLVTKALNIMDHIASENHTRNLAKHFKVIEKTIDLTNKKDTPTETKHNDVSKDDKGGSADDRNTKTVATNDANHDDYFEHLRKLETNRIEKRQNKYYCDACDVNFEVGYENTHISLESHVNKVAKINKLYENELLKKGPEYYCSVCSEWITCGLEDAHVQSERHKVNIAKEENIKSNGVVKTGINYFCEVCLVSVQRWSGEDHINSDEHKLNQNKVTNTDKVPKTSNTTNVKETDANPVKTSDQPKLRLQKPRKKLHYLFDWTYDTECEVTCLVCKMNLSYNNITSHRSSKTHKDLYKDLLNTNTMFRIRHRCFCECCREIMKVDQEYMHFTSERHRCNLTRNTERLEPSALKELSTRMFMEDIAAEKRNKLHERYARTNFTGEESDDYEENRLETDDTFWSINSSTAAFNESEEQKYSDEDDSVSDSDDSFESAETSVPALEKTTDKSEENVTVDYIILETQSQEIKLDLPAALRNNSHLLEETKNVKELICKICNCAIPNRSDLILEHVEGVKHIKNYNSILKINNLKEIFDSSSEKVQKYICKSCGNNVMKPDLFEHINSEKHKFYLTAEPSTSGFLPPVNVMKTETSMQTNNTPILAKSIEQQSDDTQSSSNIAVDAEKSKVHIKQSNQTQAALVEAKGSYESKPPIKRSDGAQLASVGIKIIENPEVEIQQSGETNKSVKAPNGAKCTQAQMKQSVQTQSPNETNDTDKTKLPTKNSEKTAIASTKSVGKIGNQQPTSGVVKNYVENGLCLVCQVNIPHTMSSIIQHLKSKEHNEKLKSLKANIDTNSLLKVDLEQKQAIDQNVSETSAHKMGNTNANKVENKTDSTRTNAHDSNIDTHIREGLCTLCNMKVFVNNVKEHVNGKNHRTKLQSLATNKNIPANVQNSHKVIQNLNTTEGSLSNTGKTEANIAKKITVPYIVGPESQLPENNVNIYVKSGHCYLCSMNIPNNVSNIKAHVNGKNHTEKLKTLADKKSLINHIFVYENPPVVSNPIQNNNSAQIQTKINTPVIVGAEAKLPENNIDTFVKRGRCYLCTMEIPNNISNIKDHVNGRNHQGNLQLMLTRNKPSVNTQKQLEVNQNLPLVPGPSRNATGKIEVSKEKATITPVIAVTEAKLPDTIMDFYVKNGYCCLCDMKIPNNISNVKDHINGRNHKQNLQSLKLKNDKNKLTVEVARAPNQSEVYNDCHICNIKVLNSPNNVRQHVESKRHKLNVEIFISGNTVKIDEQTVTTENTSSTNIASGNFPNSVRDMDDIKNKGSKKIIVTESVINKTSSNIATTSIHSIKFKSVMKDAKKHNVVAIADDDNINGNSDATKKENDNTAINSEDGTRMITDSNANIGISNSNATNDFDANNAKANNKSFAEINNDTTNNNNSDTNNPVDNKTKADDDQDSGDSYEGFYICRLCNKDIPDNEADIKSHLQSFRHKINLKEKHFKEEMLPITNTFCNVCKTDVPNNPLAAKKHADSEMHRSKFEELISDNKIKMRDNRVCYCEVCDLYFSKFSVSSHVNRSEHVKRFV